MQILTMHITSSEQLHNKGIKLVHYRSNSSTSMHSTQALCTSLQWLTNSLKWGILPLASPLQVLQVTTNQKGHGHA
ncbi:unnamed protein product [Musa textilis]